MSIPSRTSSIEKFKKYTTIVYNYKYWTKRNISRVFGFPAVHHFTAVPLQQIGAEVSFHRISGSPTANKSHASSKKSVQFHCIKKIPTLNFSFPTLNRDPFFCTSFRSRASNEKTIACGMCNSAKKTEKLISTVISSYRLEIEGAR